MAQGTRLLLRQSRFIELYLRHGNATRAAREAGYSAKTARSIGQRLLTKADIKEEILSAEAARRERIHLEEDYAMKRLQKIADVNLFDFIEIKDGCPALKQGINREDLYGVESITCIESISGLMIQRIKLKSSLAALELIAKIQGIFNSERNGQQDHALVDAIKALDAEEASGKNP